MNNIVRPERRGFKSASRRVTRGRSDYQSSKSRRVFLTFDDGPDKRFTPVILDHLKMFNVKATFFVVGRRARENPAIIRRIINEGHDIGNHTLSHPVSPILKYKFIEHEIIATGNIISQITGSRPKLFRPTWFAWDLHAKEMNKVVKELGYLSLRWSISSMDWLGMKRFIRYKIFKASLNTSEVLLFHDGSEKSFFPDRNATLDILPDILKVFKSRGIDMLKLSRFIPDIR
ncbi:MAG: hypothetical protein DRP74_02395 [Candidatus Omnitrophota bacterium]|nr:MAG: hypothetical protein DRP74_02395 [Candidatus Omnitrophota bacterium]